MPFYDYKCNNCGHKIFDIYQNINAVGESCPQCSQLMHRCIGAGIGFNFRDLPKGHNLSATKRREAWNSNDPNKFREIM